MEQLEPGPGESIGELVGVLLIGKSLPTLAREIRQDTLAHITLYDMNGQPLASTFTRFNEAFTQRFDGDSGDFTQTAYYLRRVEP